MELIEPIKRIPAEKTLNLGTQNPEPDIGGMMVAKEKKSMEAKMSMTS